MESAMSARSGAMAIYLNNDFKGIGTDYVGLGRVSLSLNRQTAFRLVFSDRNRAQLYGGAAQPYCAMKTKLEKQKSKHLCGMSDGCLSEKKRMKLLQFLSNDLSVLSTIPADANVSLTEQVRREILSDAVNVLLRQLEQARAERKERKHQSKAQKKTLKLTEKQRKKKGCCQDALSDHEALLHPTQQVGRILEAPDQNPLVMIESPPNIAEVNGDEKALHVEFVDSVSDRLGLDSGMGIPMQEANNSVIKVCMGGKCKKSGSQMLLEAFEERISKSGTGREVEAVRCKCMGKCQNAPNILVQAEREYGNGNGEGVVVHTGVGIEDIDLILAHLHFLQPPNEGQAAAGLVRT